MTGSDKFFHFMQKRIFLAFPPRTERRIRGCITYGIILTSEVICGVEHIIKPALLDNRRPFSHLSEHQLPRFGSFNTLRQCFFFDLFQIIFQLRTPNHITVCKANKIKIGFPVLIEKDGCIDSFFFSNRLLFILHKWAQRRIGRGNTDMFLYRIEHIKLLILPHIVDLRRPKPFIPVRIFFTQCQARRTLPRFHVFRTVHLETVRTGCSIGIIGIIVKQDIRIGNRQHIRNQFFP